MRTLPQTYHTAMRILSSQVHRDFELEAACSYMRRTQNADSGWEFHQAASNLENVLTTRYHFGERD